jgi:transcription elongation factor
MESTGVPGRIHVSQSTADALIATGKGHWLTIREDKVEAKGKGLLITYWASIKAGSNVGSVTGGTSSWENHSCSNDSETKMSSKDSPTGEGQYMGGGSCSNDSETNISLKDSLIYRRL